MHFSCRYHEIEYPIILKLDVEHREFRLKSCSVKEYQLNVGVGRGGAFVETITFNRRVVGSTPALAAM